MRSIFCWSGMLILLPVCSGLALGDDLVVGDAAPPLAVTSWVKGDPVDLSAAKGEKIVVIEFWATWCGPCVEAMPHLTHLQQKFGKNVAIVGVTAPDDMNTLPVVKKFAEKHASKLGYAIAFDGDDATYKAYMDASGSSGIPTSFVVDRQGRLVWIGHPEDALEETLDSMIAGKFDIELAAKAFKLEREAQALYAQARESGEKSKWHEMVGKADEIIVMRPTYFRPWRTKISVLSNELEAHSEALAQATMALEVFKNDADHLAAFSSILAKHDNQRSYLELADRFARRAVELAPASAEARAAQFRVLSALGKDDEALTRANEAIELLRSDSDGLGVLARTLSSRDATERCSELAMRAVELALQADPENTDHLLTKFDILVCCKKDLKTAASVGSYLVEQAADEPTTLNNFAWNLLTEKEYAGKFNELALRAAMRCHEVSGGTNWMYLDTLGLAMFENGRVEEAIRYEKQAIAACDKERAMPELEAMLEKFEAGRKADADSD